MTQKTFKDFDKFGRSEFAEQLKTIITKFYPFYKGAFVVSLNGNFGSGKTTFLEMWKENLEKNSYRVISINAWETDFEDEPIIPLISAILESIENHEEDFQNIQGTLKKALGATILAGEQIVSNKLGLNFWEIVEKFKGDIPEEDIQNVGEGLYKHYTFKKNAYGKLREKLFEFLEKIPQKPLLIFVDELDRARPDYSVRFLEAIKHIFSIQGLCFVLAVDRKQLEASVRQLYGSVDFENYYARFVTREASLPSVTANKINLMAFLEYQAAEIFNQKIDAGIQFLFETNQSQEILEFISDVCKLWEFTPRQIEYLFRIFSQLMSVTKLDQELKPNWVQASVLLIAIFINKISLYHRIGKGDCLPRELFDYLKKLNFSEYENNHKKRMIIIRALGFLMRDGKPEELNEIADIFTAFENPGMGDAEIQLKRPQTIQNLSRQIDEFGHLRANSPFQDIYDNLEQWRPFF